MKKTLYLFFCTLLSSLVVSCNSDDEDGYTATKEYGRPGLVSIEKIYGNNDYAFFYEGKKLVKIRQNRDFETAYKYEDGQLVRADTYCINPEIADGAGTVTFQRDGNKIIASSSGEPDFTINIVEIELDENERPVSIGQKGWYGYIDNGKLEQFEAPVHYFELAYDNATDKLIRAERYMIETGDLVESYVYEYEDTPGITSNMVLPLWYRIYCTHSRVYQSEYTVVFPDYYHNLKSVAAYTPTGLIKERNNFTYEYNSEGYPVSITDSKERKINIRY